MTKKHIRNPYNYYILFLIAISLLPIVAPVLGKISETVTFLQGPVKLLYFVYSFTCHQFAYRSLHLFDYQFAWCARDTGIWLGMLMPALLASRIRPIKWYWIVPFVIPIAIDGGFQTIATLLGVPAAGPTGAPLYISSNFIRFLTGGIFGIGISLWTSPFLYENLNTTAGQVKQTLLAKVTYRHLAGMISILLVIYFSFITVWDLTSTQYKPSDALDSAVKTPVRDFYVRRENAPCPADPQDFVRAECLLGLD